MKRLTRLSCQSLLLMLGLVIAPQTAHCQQEVPEKSGAMLLQPKASPHPLDPALEMAQASLKNIQQNISDYTALFAKRCRVDGVLPKMEYANVKIRNRKVNQGKTTISMAVYADFLSPSSVKGREVLWVEGKNDGKLIAHEVGFKSVINLSLDPNGFIAMHGQRRPITDIGMENIAIKVVETCDRDRQFGECEVQFFKNAKVGETDCTMIQVTHPVKKPQFDFYRARVYFDNSLNIPIRYVAWSWPVGPDGKPVLDEEYTYLRVKLNAGLTDQDFDISHADYRFR
jgi:hypothetical protein